MCICCMKSTPGRRILNADREEVLTIPPGEAGLLRLLLYIAAVLFAVGLVTPMLTISKFIFIKSSFSVFSGVIELMRNHNIVLGIVVAAFSIVLPILKLQILHRLLAADRQSTPKTRRSLYLMHEYGRWAMLDVFVVAVLIVTVKLGALASVQVHAGLYIFGAAVLLILLITNRIVQHTH